MFVLEPLLATLHCAIQASKEPPKTKTPTQTIRDKAKKPPLDAEALKLCRLDTYLVSDDI